MFPTRTFNCPISRQALPRFTSNSDRRDAGLIERPWPPWLFLVAPIWVFFPHTALKRAEVQFLNDGEAIQFQGLARQKTDTEVDSGDPQGFPLRIPKKEMFPKQAGGRNGYQPGLNV